MLEYELTFLAKYIPEDLHKSKSREILDIYLPSTKDHCDLRIRKNGNSYEITRKSPIDDNDISIQNEQNISLSEEEFKELSQVKGKRLRKIRYKYPHQNRLADVDVFLDNLKGLVLIEFEFNNEEEKNQFEYPDFCLADVTQEYFAAGGMLAGKKYDDIEQELGKFGYEKITND